MTTKTALVDPKDDRLSNPASSGQHKMPPIFFTSKLDDHIIKLMDQIAKAAANSAQSSKATTELVMNLKIQSKHNVKPEKKTHTQEHQMLQ